mmetsp:Transcript_119986/g.339500  ORF Transcript_119986/g.339500 Transcript_119986/m.339500 type:complete len:239 (-) Transcript_119986:787-1503(-)
MCLRDRRTDARRILRQHRAPNHHAHWERDPYEPDDQRSREADRHCSGVGGANGDDDDSLGFVAVGRWPHAPDALGPHLEYAGVLVPQNMETMASQELGWRRREPYWRNGPGDAACHDVARGHLLLLHIVGGTFSGEAREPFQRAGGASVHGSSPVPGRRGHSRDVAEIIGRRRGRDTLEVGVAGAGLWKFWQLRFPLQGREKWLQRLRRPWILRPWLGGLRLRRLRRRPLWRRLRLRR